MSDLALAERVVSLEAHPDAIADLFSSLVQALAADEADAAALRAAAGLSSQATRIVLSWMGRGEAQHLDRLTEATRRVLVDHGATAPLDGVPPSRRLAARFHELMRVVEVYRQTENAARHVGALAGGKRETWREIARWAYVRGESFSTSDLRKGGFYPRRRASANDALDKLAEAGLLAKDAAAEPARFSLTWEGRAACRALWSPEEMARDAGSERLATPEEETSLANDLRSLKQAHMRTKRENVKLQKDVEALREKVRSLEKARTARALDGAFEASF